MADQHAVSLAFLAEFWEGQDITPAAIAAHHEPGRPGWLERAQALLDGFEAVDLSDAELRRCTQSADLLFHLAVVFREAGMLVVPESKAEATARRIRDRVYSRWIERAPRFGAVATHFPRSLWVRSFVASFWAPEVLLFLDWYVVPWDTRRLSGLTRRGLDIGISGGIESASRVCPVDGRRCDGGPISYLLRRCSDCPGSRFWSPALPEVMESTRHSSKRTYFAPWGPGDDEKPWRAVRGLPLILLLLCLALPVGARQTLRGTARVVDGDTLEVQGQKVRLFGIDAPELAQTCQRASGTAYHCGWTAAVRLEEMIGGRPVRCLGTERDRYKRLIARCFVVGEHGPALDLGGALVVRGLAMAYRKYSADYNSVEATARAARVGLWAGSFVSPEEWRHEH